MNKFTESLTSFLRHHPTLAVGGGISLVLLVVFLAAKQLEAKALDLDAQWIGLALLPTLIALVVGGYVKVFKGFGVELEARLRDPVTTVPMTARMAMSSLEGDEKGSRSRIEALRGRGIERLVFLEGKTDYYAPPAIQTYLQELTSLRFLEVQTLDGRFIALIPVAEFVSEGRVSEEAIRRFIQALETHTAATQLPEGAVTFTLSESDSLVESLRKMREAGVQSGVVVSESCNFIGLLEARDIERRIADDVLATTRAAS